MSKIQLRRDTAANWSSSNPTLAQGEFGLETDTNKGKFGNGTTNYNALAYSILGLATAAEYRDNTPGKALTTDKVWDAMAEVTLTDAVTIAVDLNTGIDFTVTLAGSRTLGNPTNVIVGKRGRIRIKQDATGSRTMAYSSNYEFAGGTAPTLSTTANADDVLYYDCISATCILITSVLAVA